MRAWLATQRSWLVVERLSAYAPELNPTEGLWSSLKAVELANLTSPALTEVIDQAHKGVDRVRRTPHLATRSCAMPACRSHEPSTRGQGQGSLPVKTLVIGTGGRGHA
jgi:hypothetical protein